MFNKFSGMPFEKCWECKNMQCKIQAVNDPDSKVKQGTYYFCNEFEDTLMPAWKECCGTKFKKKTNDEQGEFEIEAKEIFDPIKRQQQLNEKSWNDIRALAKSYGISFKITFDGDMPSEKEAKRRKWKTRMDLQKEIIKFEANKYERQGNTIS